MKEDVWQDSPRLIVYSEILKCTLGKVYERVKEGEEEEEEEG